MIRLIMTRLNHTVELELPTEYEHVLVCLWRLGLSRDPSRYSLSDLNAVFRYDTPEEHQMIRLIDSNSTLMDAMISLHLMLAPPVPVADEMRQKIQDGSYRSTGEFYADLEHLTFEKPMLQTVFYFPITGEVVDKGGIIHEAEESLLLLYRPMIEAAVFDLQSQSFGWETRLFADVEGVQDKLMSAGWSVDEADGMLYGQVLLRHLEPFTEEEYEDLAEKIEHINGVEFAIRIKQWSVLTDEGLLFIYMCDRDGDYSLIEPEEPEEDEEETESCVCPLCREMMAQQGELAGVLLLAAEVEAP